MHCRQYKTLLTLVITVCIALAFPVASYAEAVGSTIDVPITFTASEAVTAADFTITVTNGTMQTITCGGGGFSSLSSNGSQCVVFNPAGATSGTLATVTVLANTPGTLTVSAAGTLSTAAGVSPSTGGIQGASYTITGSGASGTTPTSTPIGALPTSGTVSTTLIFTMLAGSLMAGGVFFFRKI